MKNALGTVTWGKQPVTERRGPAVLARGRGVPACLPLRTGAQVQSPSRSGARWRVSHPSVTGFCGSGPSRSRFEAGQRPDEVRLLETTC